MLADLAGRVRPDGHPVGGKADAHLGLAQIFNPVELGSTVGLVNAPDQENATAVAKIANPLMLHLPTADMNYLPSLTFATSPAEIERGPAYELVLNIVVDSITPTDMFRIEIEETSHHG